MQFFPQVTTLLLILLLSLVRCKPVNSPTSNVKEFKLENKFLNAVSFSETDGERIEIKLPILDALEVSYQAYRVLTSAPPHPEVPTSNQTIMVKIDPINKKQFKGLLDVFGGSKKIEYFSDKPYFLRQFLKPRLQALFGLRFNI